MQRSTASFSLLTWARVLTAALCLSTSLAACGERDSGDKAKKVQQAAASEAEEDRPAAGPTPKSVDNRPAPKLLEPVPVWSKGERAEPMEAAEADAKGYLLLDLGEDWTPYLFSERGTEDEEPVPNAYRATFQALAQGRYPDDYHGRKAREDKYLELYGITPTLEVLRTRFAEQKARACLAKLDLEPLKRFTGFRVYTDNRSAKRRAEIFRVAKLRVEALLARHGVADAEALKEKPGVRLSKRDQRSLRDYERYFEEATAVAAAQARMKCEGYLKGKGAYTTYALDWATHEALAEFERRHRVYGWGYVGAETLVKLREDALELEREAIVRVLTERAMHAAGVIEDGSTSFYGRDKKMRTFEGLDAKDHPIPNLEAAIEQQVIEAFGLQTVESTAAWLESLGPLGATRIVALKAPPLPEYYTGDMELKVEIHRGDVWYEFPYDEEGRERRLPVERRPRLVVYVVYNEQKIPLARYGTTIGGWRTEQVGDEIMFKYKNSPVGKRIWTQIVASPVWLPPESTPARAMLKRSFGRREGKAKYFVNYHETGPSYASAYGLVAAYHKQYRRNEDGTLRVYGDEGIRTHGSQDYMSIMRRHSHGCHRLHNHLAVRLMSFVLAHRPHRRVGQQKIAYRRNLEYNGHRYALAIDQGGYIFELERPLPVYVNEGRIRGSVTKPIATPVPRYRKEWGGYVTGDGVYVRVNKDGSYEEIPPPEELEEVPPELVVLREKAAAEAAEAEAAAAGEQPAGADATAVQSGGQPAKPKPATSAAPATPAVGKPAASAVDATP